MAILSKMGYSFLVDSNFIHHLERNSAMTAEHVQTLIDNFAQKLQSQATELKALVQKGDLHEFENQLVRQTDDLYNELAQTLVEDVAQTPEMEETARVLAKKKGMGSVRRTTVKLQLRTGCQVPVTSWYAERSRPKGRRKKKKQRRGPNGSGCHLFMEYWGCIHRASPGYYSYATQLCVLCPSFEIAVRVLNEQGIEASYKRIRLLADKVAGRALANRIQSVLKPGESLKGKRVLISVDGGRTRTRLNKEKDENNTHPSFDTPWKEPKLFVIHTVNDDGSMCAADLPIYDATMGNADACFDLLAEYLKAMQIKQAREVLVIADGAPWIWDRARSMLKRLGVRVSKITETVDYYHACQHLWQVIDRLVHLKIQEQKTLYNRLKKDLWEGKVKPLCKKISRLANDRSYVTNGLNYFRKAPCRFQYHRLQQKNWPCGSGIVESAIRRVINLRFKSPSTFWNKDSVERFIFLRAVLMAGRWIIMIQNLMTNIQFPKNMGNHRNFFNKFEL